MDQNSLRSHIEILIARRATLLAERQKIDQQVAEIEKSISIITSLSHTRQEDLLSPNLSPARNKPKKGTVPYNPPTTPEEIRQNNIAEWVNGLRKK